MGENEAADDVEAADEKRALEEKAAADKKAGDEKKAVIQNQDKINKSVSCLSTATEKLVSKSPKSLLFHTSLI